MARDAVEQKTGFRTQDSGGLRSCNGSIHLCFSFRIENGSDAHTEAIK
jgi:hypothetical protein